MKPWQIILFSAVGLNGLVVAAFVFTGSSERVSSVLAAALVPVLISTGLLYWVERQKTQGAIQLQKINIIGFFLKVILLGLWAAILLNSGTLHKVTFIVILLINFLAWHGVEAYYWPLFMTRQAQENGEKS
ncbi:MAG: hypothetical protein K9M49_03785 [Candidatus Marinimicrobia bacterium]|nr:hypothetical protein [Candidatus Neomarinimicrobiota bacterium]MCF7850757.1 hypothetical protein [Candidatus Neomarinimicrobiota bacterium]MCF7904255.1 hypothetical protein [Candidatus Neomarinimicrobiota bacterium]